MTSLVNHLYGAVDKAKSNIHGSAKTFAEQMQLDIPYVDVNIQVRIVLLVRLGGFQQLLDLS